MQVIILITIIIMRQLPLTPDNIFHSKGCINHVILINHSSHMNVIRVILYKLLITTI